MREGRCNDVGPDGCHCLSHPGDHADHGCEHKTWPNANWRGLTIEQALLPAKERNAGAKKTATEIADRARARPDDPDTSHEAAAVVTPAMRDHQNEVYAELSNSGPATDEELCDRLHAQGTNQTDSGIRTRRSELVDAGLVHYIGEDRLTKAGNRTRVWGVHIETPGILRDFG